MAVKMSGDALSTSRAERPRQRTTTLMFSSAPSFEPGPSFRSAGGASDASPTMAGEDEDRVLDMTERDRVDVGGGMALPDREDGGRRVAMYAVQKKTACVQTLAATKSNVQGGPAGGDGEESVRE
jgi:hypothetical protein